MPLSPSQIADLIAQIGTPRHSVLQTFYSRVARGDFTPRATAPQPRGGPRAILFDVEDACAFALTYELHRLGHSGGSPVSDVALSAMRNWSDVRPQVGEYETPLQWAIAHLQAGGDVALAIYSARESHGACIIAAIFDTEDPIIPDQPLVRIALNLGDVLLPVLARAEGLRVRKVN